MKLLIFCLFALIICLSAKKLISHSDGKCQNGLCFDYKAQKCIPIPPKMYARPMEMNNVCSRCPPGCLKCISDKQCLTCDEDSYLGQGNRCQCREGFCMDNFRANKCIAVPKGAFAGRDTYCTGCSSGCLTCLSEEKCLVCDNRTKMNKENQCRCPDGFGFSESKGCYKCERGTFLTDDGRCQICSEGCLDCVANVSSSSSLRYKDNKCNECNTSLNYILKEGKCDCKDGYYPPNFNSSWDMKQFNMRGCTNRCPTGCLNCISDKECLTCDEDSYMGQGNSCQCREGFCREYFEASKCIAVPKGAFAGRDTYCTRCSSGCLTCLSEEKCLVCDNRTKMNKKNQCQCPDGFGFSESIGCYKCERGTFLTIYGNCQLCSEGCLDCVADVSSSSSEEKCLVCDNRTKMNKENQCRCPDGFGFSESKGCYKCERGTFLTNDGRCQLCSEGCLDCVADVSSSSSLRYKDNKCNECNTSLNYILKEGKCDCKDGYYPPNFNFSWTKEQFNMRGCKKKEL